MNYVLFNFEKARKYLLEKGFVYTVRKTIRKNIYYSAYQTSGERFLGVVLVRKN